MDVDKPCPHCSYIIILSPHNSIQNRPSISSILHQLFIIIIIIIIILILILIIISPQ